MRRYRVLAELGKGGFGRVFRVREEGPAIAPDLALKLLHGPCASDEDAVRRLRDEARMLVALRHPNVVRLYRFVELKAGPALLLELVDGANLSDVLQFGPAPPRAALELVATVAEALRYAWRCPGEDGQPLRLLHRDVKPANLALTAEAEVKLLDFGIAWADLSAREARTGPEPRGTPTYMAPERRAGVDTPTVDIFGLGLVLYNLITCEAQPELPESPEGWEGFQAALAEALARKLGTDCPQREALTALVCEAVAWRPEDRPLPAAFGVRASVLARAMAGPGLKGWANQVVPQVLALAPQAAPVVGEVLEEVEAKNPGMVSAEVALESRGKGSAEVTPEEPGAARTWGSATSRPITVGDAQRASGGRNTELKAGSSTSRPSGPARAASGDGDAEPEPGCAAASGPGTRRARTGEAARGSQEPARMARAAEDATRALPPPRPAPPPRRWQRPAVAVLLLALGVGFWRWEAEPGAPGRDAGRALTDAPGESALGQTAALTSTVGGGAPGGSLGAASGLDDGPHDEAGSSNAGREASQAGSGTADTDRERSTTGSAASTPAPRPPMAYELPGLPTSPNEAQVSVTGDATLVELVSARGATRLPASVPPGAYTLRVDFLHADRPFSYGVVVLAPSGRYEVACDGSVLVCRTRELR